VTVESWIIVVGSQVVPGDPDVVSVVPDPKWR
jgi:hypothetical protein